MWHANPSSVEDIYDIFAGYVERRVPRLPWYAAGMPCSRALHGPPVQCKCTAQYNRRHSYRNAHVVCVVSCAPLSRME
jgi:hypothetical protein